MLGQSKTAFQAEIDSACELIDFWRFNVHYAKQILTDQPIANSPGIWNRTDHRPLEGFVYAITPFNFTAIAGNLPTAPALMGNTVIWKPSPTQQLAASLTMELLEEAGMPPGVINMLPGDGLEVSKVALRHPDLAGIHFTGSTADVPAPVGRRSARTSRRTAPTRASSARPAARTSSSPTRRPTPTCSRVAMLRGAFEFQGQKCSAASRAYVARSVWSKIKDQFVAEVEAHRRWATSPTSPTSWARSSTTARSPSTRRRSPGPSATSTSTVIAGGQVDDSVGYFVRPTIVESTDPTDQMFPTEYFGPILAVHVYDDRDFEKVVAQMESFAPYALTGAIIAQDRGAIAWAREALRFAAGNFYINDKPTGAVVGQQPFGGARASGTNDKAGAAVNLLRWTSPRSIKETFVPPKDYRYPYMDASEVTPLTPAPGCAAPLRAGAGARARVRPVRGAGLVVYFVRGRDVREDVGAGSAGH